MIRSSILIVFFLVLAACATTTEPTTSSTVSQADTVAAPTTSSLEREDLPSVTATTPLSVAAVFLAVVDEAMENTELEGFALDSPEDVLAIGQTFCEARDAGLDDEAVLERYLEALAEQTEPTEADATFAGVVMGAAFETLCPTTP